MSHPSLVSGRRLAAFTFLAALVLLCWDLSGLDMWLAHLAGSARGFPLRDDWLLSHVLHDESRLGFMLLTLALALSAAWPGPLAGVAQGRRLQWAASALAAGLAVWLVKVTSGTSCPWDLQAFGGLAPYLPHWSLRPDGGPGHCFPAGHASWGFALVGGYFALRGTHPAAARTVLFGALLSGLVLGLAQQWRGAHFMSHTLDAGWICWTVAWGMDLFWPTSRAAARQLAAVG